MEVEIQFSNLGNVSKTNQDMGDFRKKMQSVYIWYNVL